MFTLNTRIFEHNCHALWNFTYHNLSINSQRKLNKISKWNLIGRLIKFIANLNGSQTKKIHEVVLKTLLMIEEKNNSKGSQLIYLNDHDNDNIFYPVFLLAEKIKKSNQFKNDKNILEVVEKILLQRDKYPDSQHPLEGMDLKVLNPPLKNN